MVLNIIFALIGLVTGIIINVLADDLPQRRRPTRPSCPQCEYKYSPGQWLAIGHRLWGSGRCPQCGHATRLRALLVEIGTVLLFASLPSLITHPVSLVVNAFYIAVLILVIVIDLEHRLILNAVTFPVTGLALLGSLVVPPEENTLLLAAAGALVGFLVFYATYWIGQLMFGPGALGFGDVKLAMAMGAMLGLHRILFGLMLAILLGGIISALLLLSRRFGRRTYLPYGQYMAIAAIVMLIWGRQIYMWYIA